MRDRRSRLGDGWIKPEPADVKTGKKLLWSARDGGARLCAAARAGRA